MSTVVAVMKDRRVAVSWTAGSSVGGTRCVNAAGTPRVRQVGDSLVGYAGLTVYRNLLDAHLKSEPPCLSDEASVFEFFVEFWRQIRQRYHFVNENWDDDSPSPFADLDAEFLVANRHGLFRVKEILSVQRFERFCAIGSGAPHAEGALAVLFDADGTSEEIAERAVCVAAEFDESSGGSVEV